MQVRQLKGLNWRNSRILEISGFPTSVSVVHGSSEVVRMGYVYKTSCCAWNVNIGPGAR